MLTTAQKASILLRNGVVVPEGLASDRAGQWSTAVDELFDDYVASRAERSLREAEEARQLEPAQSPGRDLLPAPPHHQLRIAPLFAW